MANLKVTKNLFQRLSLVQIPSARRLPTNLPHSSVPTSTRSFASASRHPFHSAGAKIMDGKSIARLIEMEVYEEIATQIVDNGRRPPHLTAILVGDDAASDTYVSNKIKACDRSGITSDTIRLPYSVTEDALLLKIALLNNDPGVDGILVQLPVPPHIDELRVCNAVRPSKDVDGFHVLNMGRLYGNRSALMPATPLGIIELIRRYNIQTFGKTAVVVGRSKNVGLPTAMFLHSDGAFTECPGLDATVVLCHRYTPAHVLRQMTSMADILVVAVGQRGLVTGDMVKDGAAVFDVGINVLESAVDEDGKRKRKIVGDVDFESVSKKAGYITPVPGGVGPMTVAMLLRNTVAAYRNEIDYYR